VRTRFALPFAALLLAAAPPAWADAADGYGGYDTNPPADSGEADEDKADDKGCAHLATPVSGLSLLLGAALAFGLRRRA
jgi:hypothetical protein